MTAARRLAAFLATAVAGYSRLTDEHEAGTARAVAIATSTVTIFNDRFTSTPVICPPVAWLGSRLSGAIAGHVGRRYQGFVDAD